MDKGIGFSRTIKLDWLDVVASLCVQNVEPFVIRQLLAETISGSVHGKESQRKTIDVLTAIWVKTEKIAPVIRLEALNLFPTLTSNAERTWLHYGMTLVCYPFFRKCAASIGQVSRIGENITRNMIKDKIAGDYGHLGGIDRSVERLCASLTDWGILENTEQKQIYKIQSHYFASGIVLQSWLLTCALFAHPSEGIPFNDLTHLPELYPFKLTLGIDLLRKDTRFEVHRQGGGLDIVRLK